MNMDNIINNYKTTFIYEMLHVRLNYFIKKLKPMLYLHSFLTFLLTCTIFKCYNLQENRLCVIFNVIILFFSDILIINCVNRNLYKKYIILQSDF